MNKTIIFTTLVAATAMLAVPSVSHAGSNCSSGWNKLTTKTKRLFVPVGKVVCNALNTEDLQAAQQCIDDVERYAAQIEAMEVLYNGSGSSTTTIGTRGLAHDRTETGNVKTERQFAGEPIVARRYSLTINRTGGKAKKNLTVKVCLVDSSGDDAQYRSVTLNKSQTSKTINFDNAAGLMPLIHLNNQKWGANGHKYTIRGTTSGVAPNLRQARQTVAKSKRVKKKIAKGVGSRRK